MKIFKSRLLLIVSVLLLLASSCRINSSEQANNSPKDANSLTISAAVSLKDAFNEIGNLFKTKFNKSVNFNFGASGVLQKQIETGAPVDIFASAGAAQMDELARKNLIETRTRRDFARNSLVLVVPNDSKLNFTALSDLEKPEISKIAVGNPKTVPAGQYTEQFFEKTNLKTSVQPKLIFAEDVRQVLDYVVRGEVDAGIVYATDAKIAAGKVRVALTAPEETHAPILYPLAILQDSRNKETAQEFINLVMSAEGQDILKKYGFGAVEK